MEKKKVLIIDDEVDLVELIKMRLIANNYYVVPLYTSLRAMEIVKREKPDLVLLDVSMPDKDGYEVCKELKRNKETHNVPIILYTAKSEEKEKIKKEHKTAGADDYLLKPFELDNLLSKIKNLLKD